jgi:hypothetical protein
MPSRIRTTIDASLKSFDESALETKNPQNACAVLAANATPATAASLIKDEVFIPCSNARRAPAI